MKKYILSIVLLICCLTPARAILPHADIDKTIEKLHDELQIVQSNMNYELNEIDERRANFLNIVKSYEKDCDITTMVLYSQYENSVFGMALASHNTHDFIKKFRNAQRTLEMWHNGMRNNRKLLNSLRAELGRIRTDNISSTTKANLNSAMLLCDSIESEYAEYAKAIAPDIARYDSLVSRINTLEKDNEKVINRVSNLIFVEGNTPFPYIFGNFKTILQDIGSEMARNPVVGSKAKESVREEIDNTLYWMNISGNVALVMLVIAFILCKWILKRPIFRNNKIYWSILSYFLTKIVGYALILLIVYVPGHMVRSVRLDIEFYAMVMVIIAMQLIRDDKASIIRFFAVYGPMLCLMFLLENLTYGLYTVTFFALTLPLIYGLFFILQLLSWLIKRKKAPLTERRICVMNLLVLAACTLITWNGWTVLSIMVYFYWMAMFCSAAGLYVLLNLLKRRFRSLKDNEIWNYSLRYALYPLSVIFTIVGCAYWDVHLFNASLVLTRLLETPFLAIPNVCTISGGDILYILVVGIILNYAIKMAKVILLRIDREYFSSGKAAVAMSIGSLILWGLFMLLVVYMLNINQNGILAAVGGLSVGLGFALRDTFENCFYGLSMMIKRARPGDIVECEGIRGTINEMGIFSTSIRTEDGPVVSLPNRQLFGHTFKNMTRNDCKEIRHIIFDLVDTNDMDKVRQIILDTAKDMPGVVDFENHYIVMRHFTCGIVRLDYKCWLDSKTYLRTEPAIREAIFKAFRENGIEVAELTTELDARTSTLIMDPSSNLLPKE